MLIYFFTDKNPITSNPQKCKILPSTMGLVNVRQSLIQISPANTQTLLRPIPAAPGVVCPATLSDRTNQHLPVIAPSMSANPEPKVLSPNQQSAFSTVVPVRKTEENSLKANVSDFSSFAHASDWSVGSFFTEMPVPSSSFDTQDLMENQSATEITTISHQVNIVQFSFNINKLKYLR